MGTRTQSRVLNKRRKADKVWASLMATPSVKEKFTKIVVDAFWRAALDSKPTGGLSALIAR